MHLTALRAAGERRIRGLAVTAGMWFVAWLPLGLGMGVWMYAAVPGVYVGGRLMPPNVLRLRGRRRVGMQHMGRGERRGIRLPFHGSGTGAPDSGLVPSSHRSLGRSGGHVLACRTESSETRSMGPGVGHVAHTGPRCGHGNRLCAHYDHACSAWPRRCGCLTGACSWRARQPSRECIPFVWLLDRRDLTSCRGAFRGRARSSSASRETAAWTL